MESVHQCAFRYLKCKATELDLGFQYYLFMNGKICLLHLFVLKHFEKLVRDQSASLVKARLSRLASMNTRYALVGCISIAFSAIN